MTGSRARHFDGFADVLEGDEVLPFRWIGERHMHSLITMSTRRPSILLVVVAVTVAACSEDSGSSTDDGASSAGESEGSSGEATVEGSLVSSGLYDATWTWQPGNEAGPGIIGITLNSDKGTFGNVSVLDDGSITFTSGAPELDANGSYAGTGAQVQLKDQIPCGFTLDNDVIGATDGGVLHLAGTLTIHGGTFAC